MKHPGILSKRTANAFVVSALLTLCSLTSNGQSIPFWSNSGNSVSSADWLGSTNNAALKFRTNNVQRMSLSSTGVLQVNDLSGTGNGFVSLDASGNFTRTNFTSDPASYLGGDGQFHSVATTGGWAINGNNIYNSNPGNVGIGTNNPLYLLHVNGDAFIDGDLIAYSISGVQSFTSDTIKSGVEMEVGNKLCMEAGSLAGVCTKTGDLTLQSHAGANGNTIMNTGTTGNVGIGTFSPAYKLDVNGESRFAGKMYVHRISMIPGDSVIYFGDSSIWIYGNTNRILFDPNHSANGGIGIGHVGSNTRGQGFGSTAIGYDVITASTAQYAFVIGSGVNNTHAGALTNGISNSLMIGFNSNIPTLFVGTSSGSNTIGKVGIGTTDPHAMLQVGDGFQSVQMGKVDPDQANLYSLGYYGMNAARTSNGDWEFRSDASHNGGVLMMGDINGGFRIYSVHASTSNPGQSQTLTQAGLDPYKAFEIRFDGRIEVGAHPMSSTSQYNDLFTRMTVDGRIVCEDLVVSIHDFADYVFAPDYKLMTLDSLNNYIADNKHLPAARTASDIQQNGASLSELCNKQQQQIEELTLYILQLNERLKTLEENQSANH